MYPPRIELRFYYTETEGPCQEWRLGKAVLEERDTENVTGLLAACDIAKRGPGGPQNGCLI